MSLSKTLADNLKKTRGKVSQRAFARTIGIEEAVLHRLETGEHNPTLATLERLTKALKCKPSDLLE